MSSWNKNSLSAVYSNLSKAAEKQRNIKDAEKFAHLAQINVEEPSKSGSLEKLLQWIERDLTSAIPEVRSEAKRAGDRGTL